MKIQRLKIHNIASIEDADIDFESPELSSSELFLITGKTGSGKSTILDAICLALYASTPRLESTEIQGSIKDNDQEVTVSDPRQLLRKGKGEGFVALEFIGTNKIPYRAEWSVRRAHDKPDGRLQPKEWILTDLSVNVSYDKDSDIRPLMANAIGLNFEQFCRTTMLAQGEFTRFLNSKDKDKASILEKITGVSIYSEIGMAIYKITDSKDKELDKLKARNLEIEIPSEEEIEELKNKIEKANEEQEALEAKGKAISNKLKWLEQYAAVLTKISAAESEVQAACQKAESDEYKADCSTVADWNASAQARESYIALSQARHEKERLENLLEVQKKHYQSLLNAAEWEKEQLQNLADTLSSLQAELETSGVHKDVYLNEQAISAGLKTLSNTLSRISSESAALKDAVEKKDEVVASKDLVEKAYREAESAFNAAEADLVSSSELLEKYGLAVYRTRSEELNARKIALTDASRCLSIYERTLDLFDEAVAQKNAIKDKIAALAAHCASLSEKLNEAEVARKTAEDIRRKLERSVDEWAKSVRATLSVDDECPVCRRKVEVLPAEEIVDEVYAVANKAYEDAKAAYEKVLTDFNKVSADCKAFEVQLKAAETSVERLDAGAESDRVNLVSSLAKVGLELADDASVKIDGLLAETESFIALNQAKIREGEKLGEDVEQKRKDVETARKAKEEALGHLNDAEEKLRNQIQSIDTVKALIQELRNTYDRTVGELEAAIAGYDCIEIDWKTEPGRYSAELKRLAYNYNQLCESVHAATLRKQRCQDDCNALLAVMGQIAYEMPQWKDVMPETKVSMTGALQKANAVLADSKANKEQIARKNEEIGRYTDEIADFLASQTSIDAERLAYLSSVSPLQIDGINRSLEKVRTSIAAAKSALAEHQRTHEELQMIKPVFVEEDTYESLTADAVTCAEQLAVLIKIKGGVDERLRQIMDAKKRSGHLAALIEDAQKDYDKWKRLCDYFGNATGSTFRKIAQSYVLANLIRAANVYMKTLSDRYTLAVEPGEFVIMVEDAHDGFARRAVSTISGGESFIVSLSLALALSDIGHMLSVDILFIDEGFGTLSGEPLSRAIDTLKTLHRKSGRRVGIISHVEELKAKVPTQIQVIQEGKSSKSTIKIV